MKIAIVAGARPNFKNREGATALALALAEGHAKVAGLWSTHGAA